MQLGICADPTTLATLPTPLGFDFIEGHVVDFLKPEAADAEFSFHAAALRNSARSMPAANCFLPADLKVTGPAIDYPRLDRYAATTFRRAREIGTHIVVFGSAEARNMPAGFSTAHGFEQYVDALRHFAPLAAAQGVTIVVEPLNRGESNLVNTLLEGAEAVERAAHPNVKLLVNIFHMLRNGEPADDIRKVGPLVHHVHVAEDKDRAAPGVNGEDLRPFFRALKKINYDARLTIEATWTDLEKQLESALASVRTQLKAAGY
jgi:sugar phosphate isomerase/epimerase